MAKHFYSNIVEIDSIVVALNEMDISEDEKAHLVSLIESSIHHVVLDAILSELSEEEKKTFLYHLALGDHDQIWEYLKERIDLIEDKIKKVADDLKEELHKDIKEVKEG